MSSDKSTKMTAKAAIAAVKRAAIYVRVSSEGQAKKKTADGQEIEKTSPQAQEKQCRELAERQGYVIVTVYRDIEKYRVGNRLVEPSGTRNDRPGLRAMLAGADAGKFDVLIAWREDRLYRGVNRAMLDINERVSKGAITIELVKEHYDPGTAVVKAWAAGVELQAKHDRMMMGVAGRFEDGKDWNGCTPYGYTKVEGQYIEYQPEAVWVKKIWRWFGAGLSIGEIRQRLIEGGAPQRNKTKYPWTSGVLYPITKSDFYYTGTLKRTWGGETYELSLPILIDADTASSVQARYDTYKTYPSGNLKEKALAAGLVYCKVCDIKMLVKGKHNTKGEPVGVGYYCSNFRHNLKVDDCAKSIALKQLDAQLWDKLWATISQPGVLVEKIHQRVEQLQAQQVDARAECERLEKRLDNLAFERQKVVTWARQEIITEDDLKTQLAALMFEEAGIRRELNDVSLLLGNEAERLLAVARTFQERVSLGIDVNITEPQTPAEAERLWQFKRLMVERLVTRVKVKADKSLDIQTLFDEAALTIDRNISISPAAWRLTDIQSNLFRVLVSL